MRFLHTSDWHLGRAFNGVGLLDAQAGVLDHLVATAVSERVGAVVVSGDIYDKALPNPDAVALLSETLGRLVDAGVAVVLTSGNHDSAIRLGFASGLLARSGVHIRTTVPCAADPVVIDGVAIYPLPYLEPALAAEPLGAGERTHAAVLRAALAPIQADIRDRGLPSVVMAHAFVTGGAGCESERDISAGGVSAVHPDVFAGISYVAMGHLHGRQQVADTVRYSGSPVAMSFGEANHVKGYTLVDLGADGAASVQLVAAPVARPLAVLRGPLAELLADPRHTPAERAWVAATLTDPTRPLGAMETLRRRFPHAIKLDWAPEGAVTQASRPYAARLADRDDLEVCCDFLQHVRGGVSAGPAERRLLRAALEGSRLARAQRNGEGNAARPRTQRVRHDDEVA
ncbi:MAG: exonuclease SbcCD subunit D [Nostocoides sp.]